MREERRTYKLFQSAPNRREQYRPCQVFGFHTDQLQDLYPALYPVNPMDGLRQPIGADSTDKALYQQDTADLLGQHDSTGLVITTQAQSLTPDPVEQLLELQGEALKLQEQMSNLRLGPGDADGSQWQDELTDVCTDLQAVDGEKLTEESRRRRALSLPVKQCLGLCSPRKEARPLLCCCKLKKRVQFADSLGLSLASVKHFLPSDEPLVPPAVMARLQSYPPTGPGQRAELTLGVEDDPANFMPVQEELRAKAEAQGLCLEQVSDTRWGVRGCILVSEPGETVQVKVRYTFNEWLSYLDCPATALENGASTEPQRFMFTLCYPPSTSHVQFAICCSTGNGQELWDNNQGDNYTVSCYQEQLPEFQASDTEQEQCAASQQW